MRDGSWIATGADAEMWMLAGRMARMKIRRRGPRHSARLGALALTALIAGGCPGEPDTPTSRASHASSSSSSSESAPSQEADFVDVAREVGFVHRHHKPVLDPQLDNIMSWMASVGAAAAAGDFDRDGWIDLYVTDSRKGETNRLYRNDPDHPDYPDGRSRFEDVAEAAGLARVNGEAGTSMDAVWGDYDADGWPDLYLVRWGHDALFRNRGDGTFEDVTRTLFEREDGSPGMPWANGNAAIFLDYDLDGRLDIYIGNYFQPVDLWHLDDTRIMHDSFETARNGGRNFLFHQQPDGRFREVAHELAVDDVGWTLAVGSADIDNDGWPDLFCANDFGPDRLFLNDRSGGFVNVSEHTIGSDTKKGMNVDFGDFNNDGWLDIFVANITTSEYLQEGDMLWHNDGLDENGALGLTDISLEAGTFDGGWGWGAKFFDYDNDGDLDLAAANGFISAGEGSYWYDLASWTVVGDDPTDSRNWPPIGDRSFSGYEAMRLWRNDGFDSFSDHAHEAGITTTADGRGVVTFDYDNDGDLDLYVANQDQAPNLYRNDSRQRGHWLVVELETDPSSGVNRDAIGARVTLLMPDGQRMIRERDGGNGFSGQSDPRLHFGLGRHERVPLLEVRWPDGGVQYLEDVPADRPLVLRQEPGRYVAQLRADTPAPQPARVTRDAAPTPAPPSIDPEELERRLRQAEEELEPLRRTTNENANWGPASFYRGLADRHGEQTRAIRFFEAWVKERPSNGARIELAAAYVDDIPNCGGLAAIVCKGSLARKGLLQLDPVIAERPDSWIALYSRGMNHLHWPRALRHSDAAAADFERCIDLQKRAPESRPYFARAHLALGDSLAKDGRYEAARQAWQRGQEHFADFEELAERLAIKDDAALLELIEEVRSLQRAIDTDLSFYYLAPSHSRTVEPD